MRSVEFKNRLWTIKKLVKTIKNRDLLFEKEPIKAIRFWQQPSPLCRAFWYSRNYILKEKWSDKCLLYMVFSGTNYPIKTELGVFANR